MRVIVAPKRGSQAARIPPRCLECGQRSPAYHSDATHVATNLLRCVGGHAMTRRTLPGFGVLRRWAYVAGNVHYVRDEYKAACGRLIAEIPYARLTVDREDVTCEKCCSALYSEACV